MSEKRKFVKERKEKEVIFYLVSESTGSFEGNVWFVNNSDEILDEVRSDCGGFATFDDEVATMEMPNPMVYENVQPSEAVLIDTYNAMFDSDFMVCFGVAITSPSFGKNKSYSSGMSKGGNSDAVIHWKPLPEEIPDPDNPNKLLAPEKAAAEYMKRTGCFLDKSVSLNRGDLRMDYAAKRLAPSGVLLEKPSHREGKVIEYEFSEESGTVLFRTCDFEKACVFIETLRK